jgi:hypothetical protein
MRQLRDLFVAFCCVAQTITTGSITTGSIAAGEVAAKPTEVASALAAIERPRRPVDLKNACRTIFEHASEGKLRELREAKSLPLSLGAAWRTALQSCAGDRTSPSRATFAFSRFVGFVEGRLPVQPPEWWERIVAGAMLAGNDGDSVTIRCHPKSLALAGDIPRPAIPEFIALPKGWSANKVAKGVELQMPGTRVLIPTSIPKDASGRPTTVEYWGMLSTVTDGDSVFVVVGSDDAYCSEILAKVSRRGGKVLWERRIWTGGELTGISLSGPSFGREHIVEPKMGRDGNVYVFGATVLGAHIESFSATDGTPQLRFCTLALQEWL